MAQTFFSGGEFFCTKPAWKLSPILGGKFFLGGIFFLNFFLLLGGITRRFLTIGLSSQLKCSIGKQRGQFFWEVETFCKSRRSGKNFGGELTFGLRNFFSWGGGSALFSHPWETSF